MGFEKAVMVRNSTACAMEWSIELEKALRSKNPGRRIEAIYQIGLRLEQWSGEPEGTMVVYDMFGLVPGEDRLFANTIFLRLADAFQLGNKHTRVTIVRIFLSLLKHCRKKRKNKQMNGVLSKSRVQNHLELLKRVKAVFDSGDVESRALALVLFGCWADFAKDSAQIRYLVLSSLVSSNVLEVRASLFATGCFSELADDFSSVVLEMVVNMVTSSETESVVRLAAVRAFAKMGCTFSNANRAFKAGLKLVVGCREEDILVAMLASLSKLCYKSTVLISEQVDFLLSLFNSEKTLRTQATSLRCLHFIFSKGMCQSIVGASVIKTLISITDNLELPSTMQCEALQILHKIFLCTSSNLSCVNMPEFAELLRIVDNASQSPNWSKSLHGIHILVDVLIRLQRITETDTLPLPSQVVSLIMDRVTLLVKTLSDLCQFKSTVFQDIQNLLKLLYHVVRKHPDLGVLVLDKVHSFVEDLVNSKNNVIAGRQADSAVNDNLEFNRESHKAITSKLVCIVNRFVVSCLESLHEAGAINNQVFDKVKLLVECAHHCNFLNCYTHTIYSILLHSQIIWGCMVNRNEEAGGVEGNSHIFVQNSFVEHELFTLEFAKRMLTQGDNWPAYKSGIYAACQGVWTTANFMFGQIITKVQSDTYGFWLKSLSQWAHCEIIIQQLVFVKQGSISFDWLENMLSKDDLSKNGEGNAGHIHEIIFSQALDIAYKSCGSAGRTLETILTSGKTFCFQGWFLALRAKFLGVLVDIFGVLSSLPSEQDNIANDSQVGKSLMVERRKLLRQITQISFKLKRLSQEYDLIASSFTGMDSRSSKILKALALSCSVLAFSTGFALYTHLLPTYGTLMTTDLLEGSQNCSHVMLIQNLLGRLWNLDHETSTKLCMLLEVSDWSKNCFHLQSGNQRLTISCEVKDIVEVCGYAVSGIVCLQHEANKVHNEENLSKVTKNGFQLLSSIILKWMCIPFRAPKYFFKIRPCFGSELLVSCAGTSNLGGIFISTGFHLSLNLCLQLKNASPDLPVRLTKFYCILCCSQNPLSDRQNSQQTPQTSQAWETDNMVEMNEKLFQYVTQCAKKTNHRKRARDTDIDNDGRAVNTFVHFEPNDRGQGFSNCLLDVSQFPVGSYRIKWHSCCIDSQGSYWSLLPLNAGPLFTIK
ncbi:hypothetical protein Patl1_12207 [Pistacia atlantica]|uniref:Uncharacterized protein n=1 Tax=Pistacia atlantica TaxID=434234 RepID=A0ACC1A2K3_9ROSI|nr:hypothetical protein Patl1_12207 [Pistacia atlantica]